MTHKADLIKEVREALSEYSADCQGRVFQLQREYGQYLLHKQAAAQREADEAKKAMVSFEVLLTELGYTP